MGQRLHRRLASILGTPVRSWTLTPPATVNGSGAETQYSGYVSIPDPKPKESALYAVPAPNLTAAGSLISSVQFLDASNAVISESTVQTLSTQGDLTGYEIEGTGNAAPPYSPYGWTPVTGTFYSSWSALPASIPAGQGKLFGVSAYLNAGTWWDSLLTPPYNQLVTLTAHLEFGDALSNVVASTEVATYHYEHVLLGYDEGGYAIYDHQQTLDAAFVAGQSITITSTATKKRCKMVISEIRYAEPYCRIETGGYVEI